jgi:hypothetical protein
LDRHLAFATLANLSQHPVCRRMVYTQSLKAGFSPPGVARVHNGPVVGGSNPVASAFPPADAPGSDEGGEGSKGIAAGDRPLHPTVGARRDAGVFVEAPTKSLGAGVDSVALHVAR